MKKRQAAEVERRRAAEVEKLQDAMVPRVGPLIKRGVGYQWLQRAAESRGVTG